MLSSNRRLLVIDDEVQICELVAEVAENVGFEVAQATTHETFRRYCREFAPSVIILDLAMPDGDGVELLRFLSDTRSEASIVLISGFDNRVLNAARKLGEEHGLKLIGALQKPISILELETLLSAFPRETEDLSAGELMEALNGDQIEVHYQPKVHQRNCTQFAIDEVEALVRWRHPTRGLLTPAAFLDLARRDNLMLPLTRLVSGQALRQVAAWQREGRELAVALNLEPHLLTNLGLPDEFAEMARSHGVPAERVTLEITERGVMEDPVTAIDILTRFRLKGFFLSIDDFGTGFSSLAQIYRMPFSELKIDQSFVRDVTTSEEARVIVATTTNMAHGMKLSVCAEGVEDMETCAFLRSCGCEKFQGYLVSRPVDGESIVAMGPAWNPETVDAVME